MTKDTVIDVLHVARQFIENGWTKRAFARETPTSVFACSVESKKASCFCASGAIQAAKYHLNADDQAHMEARSALLSVIHWDSIPLWNDAPNRTQEQVVNAFDRAIERLQKGA